MENFSMDTVSDLVVLMSFYEKIKAVFLLNIFIKPN